jgi:L-aminopeptidase/D-esterase-like protein
MIVTHEAPRTTAGAEEHEGRKRLKREGSHDLNPSTRHDVAMSSITEGFRIGHWTDEAAHTGCTVILPPAGNVASCDIRGSSPSSRELALLDLDRRLTEIHAVLLTGGSAFGLAAAQGVVEWLAERGIGYQTAVTPVPIVPAAVIFDLGAGPSDVRPGPEGGRAACDDAVATGFGTGRVGVGTGATVGKWSGFEYLSPGGFGVGSAADQGMEVTAVAVVNSVGDVIARDGTVIAGTRSPNPKYQSPPARQASVPMNTVLACVMTKATLDKRDVRWLAARGSDGIAMSVRPAHTRYDGDVVFGVAASSAPDAVDVNLDILGVLATEAVAAAVRNAVS